MDRREYIKAIKDVIYLAYCGVNGKIPGDARVRKMDITAVYEAANKHLLTAICAMSLESAGAAVPSARRRDAQEFRQYRAAFRRLRVDRRRQGAALSERSEIATVLEKLDDAGRPFRAAAVGGVTSAGFWAVTIRGTRPYMEANS